MSREWIGEREAFTMAVCPAKPAEHSGVGSIRIAESVSRRFSPKAYELQRSRQKTGEMLEFRLAIPSKNSLDGHGHL